VLSKSRTYIYCASYSLAAPYARGNLRRTVGVAVTPAKRAKDEPVKRGDPPGKRDYVSVRLGERLKHARLAFALAKRKDVTPTDVAEMIGIAGYSVSRYEDGSSEPTLKMIEALAEVLGVTPEWLAFGVEPAETRMGDPLVRAPQLPLRPARSRAELEAEVKKRTKKHG
jgi:transcriptional regulator with XRE-family HTH domain